MKTRQTGLSGPTGKNKTGKRASKAVSMPLAPLGQPAEVCNAPSAERKVGQIAPAPLEKTGGQTAPGTPAPKPAPAAASAPKPALMEGPTPKPMPPQTPVLKPAQAQPAAPVAPRTVDVGFSVFQPQARAVSVCGEFNGWSAKANPMKLRGEGLWQTVVALKPGRYQYKFVVDGEWMPDPEAKQNVGNSFGTLNSVVEAG
jgi:hypothetical protein